MKITTATLIAMLALGSTFTFAQNGNTAAAKTEAPESYSVTVTTVVRPLIPGSEAKGEYSVSDANSSVAANATSEDNLKFSVSTSEVDRLPLDENNTLEVIATR